jgi:rhodanese-related sulfurtransferase
MKPVKNFGKDRFMKHLVLLIALSVLTLSWPAGASMTRNLGAEETLQLLQRKSNVYLLDVRTPAEFWQARLRGAKLIPIDQLAVRIEEIPKNRPIIVYCAVGSRSAQVVHYLTRKGYPEVYNMSGGIYSWAARGYPVLQGGP